MTNTKKINLIFILLFLGDALLSPFLAIQFTRYFQNYQVGILLALKPACSLLGNMIYGHFSKGFKRDVNLMKIIAFFNGIATLGFAFAQNFVFSVILMAIWSTHNSVLFSFCDGVGQKCCTKENKVYSLTRMFGSFGYLIGLLIGGSLGICNLLIYPMIFSISAILMFAVVISLFFLAPFDTIEVTSSTKISSRKLFESSNFIKYMIFYFFVLGVWKIVEDYSPTIFTSLGLTDGEWSFLYAVEVVIEIVTIVLLNKFMKSSKGIVKCSFISALLITIRTFIFALPINTIVLISITGVLRGISYGLFVFSFMETLKRLVGPDYVTKGVALLAIEQCVISTFGNFFYLQVLEAIGYTNLYIIFGVLQIIGLISFLLINFSKENNITDSSNNDTILKE